jgi:hypothetical protein
MTIADSADIGPRDNADRQQFDLVGYVAAGFDSNAAFHTLLSKLSQSMAQEEVMKMLQRAFKRYRANMQKEDGFIDVQKATTILKMRKYREDVARRLVNFHAPLNSNITGPVESQEEDSDAEYGVDDEVQSDEEEEEEEEEGSDDLEIETEALVKRVFDAELAARQPFQLLLVSLKEILLPSDLLDDLLSVPRDRITYESYSRRKSLYVAEAFPGSAYLLERAKRLFLPTLPPLNDGEARVHWRCVSSFRPNGPNHVLTHLVLRHDSMARCED